MILVRKRRRNKHLILDLYKHKEYQMKVYAECFEENGLCFRKKTEHTSKSILVGIEKIYSSHSLTHIKMSK